MLSIAEIREQYPDTKDLSDSEILFRVSKLTQLPLEQVAQDFGINDPKNAPKGTLGGVNDFMINTANAAVGALKSGVDFFSPGSSVSKGLEEFIQSGEQKLSLQERLSQQRFAEGLNTSEFGPQAGAVLERVKEAPLQVVGQALGSFAIPGATIKGVRGAAGALGVGERAVQKATQFGPINRQIAQEVTNKALSPYGTGAAMGTGAILSGGDAAGDAYDRVLAATGDRELATQAAREASIIPALVGSATSLIGADRAIARGGSRSILRTTGGEFTGEFLEEGTTKASANYVTGQYVPDTDVFAGVFGSGLMGGIQGAGTGAAVGLMSRQRTMLSGSNEIGGQGGLQSDGSGIGKAINIDDAAVNTKTAIPPRGPITVTSGGEALLTPEQQQAYDQFGRNQVGVPPQTSVQQSGQVAAANLQQQQQQAQATQEQVKQQQAQQAQQQFTELASVYGLSGGQPGSAFKLAGKNLFTQGDAELFLRAVDKLNEGKTLEQKQAFGSVIASGAVKIKPDATAKAVVNSVNTFMDKWGLGSSENTTDLAERVNANIETVEGSNAVNLAGPLNDLYRGITGQDSPAFTALIAAAEAPAAKGQKKGKAAPAVQQPSAVTSADQAAIAEAQARLDAEQVAKSTQGAGNDGQLPVQDNAGLRDVRVQGGTTGSNQEGLGLLQPQPIQSVESGSVVGGQNSVQDDAGRDAGTRTSTDELATGRDADTRSDERSETQKEVREIILISFGERDTDIIYDVLTNDLSGPEIAKIYRISQQRVDQIAGPKARKSWGPRIEKGAKRLGKTLDDVAELFAKLRAEREAGESGQDTSKEDAVAQAQARLDAELAGKERSEADKNLETNTEDKSEDDTDDTEDAVDIESTSRTLSDEFDREEPDFDYGAGIGVGDIFERDSEGETKNKGVRIFQVGKTGEVGAEDASANNRSYAKFKKNGAKNLKEFEVNNILAEVEDLSESELVALLDRAKQLEEIRLAKAKDKDKPQSKKPEAKKEKEKTKEEVVAKSPAEQWAEAVAPFDGAAWDSLSEDQQERWEDLVSRGTANLAAATKIAGEKPAEKVTPKQKADAQKVAARLGGSVVWQDGRLALVRAHSVLNGQPVYLAALGTEYGLMDIESYTGSLVSAEQKAELVKIKNQLETEAVQKHKDDPFITFSRDGIAVSKNVPAALVGVATGWKKMLGISANIYITTIEDARADKDNFTGPHRAISSSALDAREKGSMRKMPDGSYYIAFTKSTSQTQMLEVLAHEMGHIHEREAFKNAPKATQEAIIAEHKKWVESQKGKSGKELVESLRARAAGRATGKNAAAKAEDMDRYWTSFGEWYADQVSRWAVTSEKPMSVVEKFFARLAAAMKKFYYSLKGQKYLPTETMKQFLDNSSQNLTTQEMASDTDNFESSSMFAGAKALKRSGDPDNLANLVAARIMESSGVPAEEIWKDTGWYRGVDGQWRFEISDQDSEMLDSQQWGNKEKLGNILEHPELFSMYPQLRNLTVNVVKSPFSSPSGAFIASDNSIIMMPGQATEQEIKEVLLHEVQHAVQEIEGFSGGANPQTVDVTNTTNLQKVKVVLQNQINLENELSIADKNKNAEYIKVIDSLIDKSMTVAEADKKSPQAMETIRQLIYTLTSGEVEARNVEKRLDMDVFERQQTPPSKSQDVRNEVQILGSVGGNAASIAQVSKFAEKEIAKLPEPYRGPLNAVMDTLLNAARKGLVTIAFTKDLAAMAYQKGLKSAIDYVGLMGSRQAVKTENERKVDKIAGMFDKLPSNLKGTGAGSVNAFLKESTMGNKWGFQPSWVSKPVKVDPEMEQKFDALPAEAKAVIKAVFKHGYDTLMDMKKGVMDNINTEYDALIADAQLKGDAKEVAELQKSKADSLKNYQSLMAVNANSPYAPLKRFGNYVVVGRSAAYIEAEETATNDNAPPEDRKEARKALEKMQTDEKHYFVQFAETNAEAKAIARENKKFYPDGVVQNFEKEQVRDSLYGGRDIQGVFYRLRNLINESQDDKKLADASQRALNRLVNDLHLSLLSEHSARQSERRRKGVAGADDDMMRAFVTQGRATAHFLSTLHNTGAIYDSLQAMKEEAGGLEEGRDVRSQYYNEMLKRHAMSLEYQVSPFVDKAMSATSTWMLLTSPAYYMQNMTQPFMMSLPVIAAKHGYTKSASEMIKAYKELTKVLTKNGLNEDTYSKLPADVQNAIESLVNSGHIDIGLSQDLGRWRSSGDQNAAARAMDKIRSISEDVEAVNRVVTAVAAYRLDKAAGASEQAAVKYAGKVVYDTHGDYSGFNAPRFSRQGIGRLATQFRKFQLIQISLIAKLGNQAFKGATDKERAIGRRALAFTLTHTFAVGGVMGLPGFTAIAWILGSIFGDSDEPDNPEATLRKMIGDDALADLLLKGVPKLAGVDLSGKLGMGQMLSVLPYTDIDMSRDGYSRAVTAAMGPFIGGIMPKVVDGVAQMSNGQYYKGIETMAPSGLSQAMKGYRFATEGITKRNGEVILSPEEITFLDAFMQGIGLPTRSLTDRQFINRTQTEYEQFYSDRSSDIKRDYISAYKKGDSESMEQARIKWMEMQDSRQANGFKRQPMSELFRAPMQAMKREVRTVKNLNTSGATAAGFSLR